MHTATSRAGKSANELMEEMEPYIARVSAEYPNYGKWWSENWVTDVEKLQEDSFTLGMERLLDGLETWLDRKQ
ncbi:MAG: hypothetical protein ACRDP6_40480 [Actinoallomurus sp.]